MTSDTDTNELPEDATDELAGEELVDDDAQDEGEEEKPKLTLEVKVEEPSACERHIAVSISREDIDRYFSDQYDELMPKAEVPGFRPGHAPRKLVEKRFRQQIGDQVKGNLLMDSMTQINEDHEFSAISEPDFDFEAVELPDEGPMTFEFDLEVRPEFEMPEWRGMKIEKPVREYADDDVDRHMKNLLSRYADLVPFDGAAEADDYVTVNATFTADGQVVSRLEEQNVRIKSNLSFPDGTLTGFDKLMAGAEADSKKVAKVTLSPDAANENLRDKEVDVEFEVLDVKKLELPKMDAAFLDRIGGFESEEQVREAVKGELERQLNYHQQQRVRQQITSMLTESANWELPPDLVKRQSSRELERAVMELRASGFDESQIRAHENELMQNSMQSTETALKEHFILERIAEEEEIADTPEDYDREIAMIAVQQQESPRRVRARLEKRGQMDTLRNQIIERKVIELITSEATFNEVPFEPEENKTEAVEHLIGGPGDEPAIPEAKHGGQAEELNQPAIRD